MTVSRQLASADSAENDVVESAQTNGGEDLNKDKEVALNTEIQPDQKSHINSAFQTLSTNKTRQVMNYEYSSLSNSVQRSWPLLFPWYCTVTLAASRG